MVRASEQASCDIVLAKIPREISIFLRVSAGTYQGRAAWKTPFTNFPAVDKWEATGLQTNYYWQSGDAMASPLGLQQGTVRVIQSVVARALMCAWPTAK